MKENFITALQIIAVETFVRAKNEEKINDFIFTWEL